MNTTNWRSLLLYVSSVALVFGNSAHAADAQGTDSPRIKAGDSRFHTPEFEDFEALYTSGSSTTGAFTLQVRSVDRNRGISLIDIIPMSDYVIMAQRRIDSKTHQVDYSHGPSFAWGEEFVVRQMKGGRYDWVRVPVGGGEAIRMQGELENGPFISDMFSPTLASLMPMDTGDSFQLPVAVPRKDNFVSSWWEEYRVLRREHLETPSGLSCECWVIEKSAAGGGKTHIWVAREAPFVFRRNRDVGGKRELISDLLSFRALTQ